MGEQLIIPYNRLRGIQIVQGLFDALINYINRVAVTFENTSPLVCFYTKIFEADSPKKKTH